MGLALAACIPPGAITAEAVRRGMARGFWPALLIELGSLVGDATWASIALVGIAFLVQNALARLLLGAVGTLLLLYLAWSALRDAQRGGMPQAVDSTTNRGDLMTGTLLSLSNPFNLGFWLSMGSSAIVAGVANPRPIHFVVGFLSFMLGCSLWCFFFAGLVAWGRRFINPTVFRVVNVLSGLFFGYSGLRLAWDTLQSLPTGL
jgi:chemosensory pili system protein ChpE